jgi:hypothetical protein
MTPRDEVIAMARKVGYPIHHPEWQKAAEEFAALVEAKTKEAEAKDAARYRHIQGMARVMSPKIDGNHTWHMGLRDIRGPSLDEAIDSAIITSKGAS